jgi:hypothetical protein
MSALGQNKQLSEIFSAVKFGDCVWAMFDPIGDILAIMRAAIAGPISQSRDGLFVAVIGSMIYRVQRLRTVPRSIASF